MSSNSPESPERTRDRSSRGTVYLGFPYPVAAVLVVLAMWFWFGPSSNPVPEKVTSVFDSSRLSTDPPRAILSDPPTAVIGGFAQRCSDCHSLFDTTELDTSRPLAQHTDIVLDHGMNDRCINCHAREDRNALVGSSDREIGYDQVELLCAKCHGTTYRDWQRGMHGRTHGSWDPSSGNQTRLKCTECHDPHAPAYDPIVPMPPPNTLRQGYQDPEGSHGHHGAESPLTKWKHALHPADEDHGGHR